MTRDMQEHVRNKWARARSKLERANKDSDPEGRQSQAHSLLSVQKQNEKQGKCKKISALMSESYEKHGFSHLETYRRGRHQIDACHSI